LEAEIREMERSVEEVRGEEERLKEETEKSESFELVLT